MERLDTTYVVPGVTPAQCFAYVGDVSNGTEWNSFVKEVIAHGEEGIGRVVESRIGFVGITFGVKGEVTEYEKDVLYAVTSSFPFRAVLRARYSPEGDGTRVHSEFEIEPGKFFPVPKIVLRKALKLQFDKDTKTMRACLAKLAQS
jgi:hypothetical protein